MSPAERAAFEGMVDALQEVAEGLDGYADIEDGSDGEPRANWAMRLMTRIERAIAQAEAAK